MPKNPQRTPHIPAACYLRRSTGLQYYSLEHQISVIKGYAIERGYKIVRTFSDDKSGLTLSGRPGLKALLEEALGGQAPFVSILVYDVSRWGRFQDLDQGAHLEFLCRRAGIAIEYCNEPFDNDGSPQSNLIKQIKRSIAAEYSRDLSQRLSRARLALAAKGFHQCGRAPFGLRRLVLDQNGNEKGILEDGQRKLLAGYRTVLTLGPASEVKIVRSIFNMYVKDDLSRAEIARRLNDAGKTRSPTSQWTRGSIAKILANRIYVGDLVFGRTSSSLASTRQARAPEDWVHLKGAVTAIIGSKLFARAQKQFGRPYRISEQRLLGDLLELERTNGSLQRGLIAGQAEVACIRTYQRRFGSLNAAFKAALAMRQVNDKAGEI